jgi:hypothetical protein
LPFLVVEQSAQAAAPREGRVREDKSRDIMRYEPSDDSRIGRIAQIRR